MRVYPAGTRITSHNLYPIDIWASGAQIAALNWQTFDASLQINDALFAGSNGFVLKPPQLRTNEAGQVQPFTKKTGKVVLKLHVVGASNLPLPPKHTADSIRPYVTASLYHPSFKDGKPSKSKTSPYHKHHGLGSMLGIHHHPPPTQPFWDETLDWEYDAEGADLVVLRILIKSDDRFARNPVFAVTSIRAMNAPKGTSLFFLPLVPSHLQPCIKGLYSFTDPCDLDKTIEYVFLRLLDLSGVETNASLLVRFTTYSEQV